MGTTNKEHGTSKDNGSRTLISARTSVSDTPPSDAELPTTIYLALTLPNLDKIRQDLLRHINQSPFKRTSRRTMVGKLLIALVVVSAGFGLARSVLTTASEQQAEIQANSNKLPRVNPTFNTLLPGSKTAEQLGGWARVSPPDRNPVYAYADTLDSTPITVSQQPVPGSLEKGDTGIEDLAKSYAATTKLDVSNATAYLGASTNGPQSVIVKKNNLLILIKSNAKVSDKNWKEYISSLQ